MRTGYYLRNYLQFVKLNIQTWAEGKLDFVIGIVAIFLTNVTTVVFFWVIFQHIPTLNGWSFAQLLFMFGFLALSTGIWHVFLTGCSPWSIDRLIRRGELDRYMLRPANTLALVIMRNIDEDGLGDMAAGIMLLIYSSSLLGIMWSPQMLLVLTALMAGSVLVVFAITLFISSIAFWVTSVNSLMELFWSAIRFAEYPIDIFSTGMVWILTYIFPIGFASFYPSQFFLQNVQWMPFAYATPLIGIALLAIAYASWRYGIKNYASVGN
jgi:ABC-2 type transport system permease protein